MTPFFSDPFLMRLFPWSAGILGLVLGSFYSVCAHRYVTGQSIVLPPSHCPACGHRLSWWELLPLGRLPFGPGQMRGLRGAHPPWLSASGDRLGGLGRAFGPAFRANTRICVLLAVGGLFIVASAY
jgi:leader peptidase (prepilin peptidase)/N-methyltransferase